MFIVCISLVFGTTGCSKKPSTYKSKKKTIKINLIREEATFYNGVRIHNEVDEKNTVFKDGVVVKLITCDNKHIQFSYNGKDYWVDLEKGSNENQFTIEYYNDTYVKQK